MPPCGGFRPEEPCSGRTGEAVDTGLIETAALRAVAQVHRSQLQSPAGERHDVHLAWCDAPDDEVEPAVLPTLGPWEREKARAFVSPRGRGGFLRGRLCAKTALAAFDGARRGPADFTITPGAFGQPVVWPGCGLDVALSHAGRAAAAVAFPAGWPLALDIEWIDAANVSTIRSQLAPGEEAAVMALGLPVEVAVTVLWSAREALSKVLRGGLAISFPTMRVADVTQTSGHVTCGFADFAHCRAEVAVGRHAVLAMVLPANCTLDWPGPANWIAELVP